MTPINKFFSTINNLQEQKPQVTTKIEGVILHVRARELLTQKRSHNMYSVVASFFVGLGLEIITFITYPYTNSIRFLLCATAATIAFYWSFTACMYTYFLAYVACDAKRWIDWFRATLFDLLDVVSFGSLTLWCSKILVSGGQGASELALRTIKKWYLPTPIAYHFYTSRHAMHRIPLLASTEESFLTYTTQNTDEATVMAACNSYWTENV